MIGPYKVLYRVYRDGSRLRHWALRRFTRAGLVVFATCLASATLAVDTENTVAYQAFALLACLLTVSLISRWRFKVRISATRLLPRFGTIGQALVYPVLVKNLSQKTRLNATVLEDLENPRPTFADWLAEQRESERLSRSLRISEPRRSLPFNSAIFKPAPALAIPPEQEREVQLELSPLRRGIVRFTGITLARADPLGLVRALLPIPIPQTLLILPRRYPLPPITLPGTRKYQQGGVALASSVGQSEDFVGLRDYHPGDPMRHIHWRSWAKAGKPVVKEFEDEFFVRHALVLDTFSSHPHSQMFEEAVSVAASFACTIDTRESLLDLLFVGSQSYCFTAGRGLAHADQMLEILASVRPCQQAGFAALEHLLLNHVEVISGCICVLLKWDRERSDLVRRLRGLGIPVLVLVLCEPGQAKTLDPGPMRDELDRFRTLELGQIEQGLASLS